MHSTSIRFVWRSLVCVHKSLARSAIRRRTMSHSTCFTCVSGVGATRAPQAPARSSLCSSRGMQRLARRRDVRPMSRRSVTGRTALLWFGEGALRLADCGAVAAACMKANRIVAVAVVTNAEMARCARAVSALEQELIAKGSRLIVRVVHAPQRKAALIQQLARCVRANSILASNALYTPAAPDVCFCAPVVLDAPVAIPPPPASAIALASHVVAAYPGAMADGERIARVRLRAAVRAGTGVVALTRMFASELKAGSLAYCRVQRANGTLLPPRVYCASAGTLGLITAYDVLDSDRRSVEWDSDTGQFRLTEWEHTSAESTMTLQERWAEFVRRRRRFLFDAFFPPDVTPDYYAFTAWRFTQRCMSATVGVFGTQALLLALGVRAGRIGQAAAISWVLKDGLGRVGKMVWASGMGKDFDVDPKRWRFRSALLYSMGNGLEIVTQLFPASFLLFATAANSMKQVSMLTSSACRNAMYRSFAGDAQNIANITAKGEAQIVIADLIGMVSGIRLSKLVGTSKRNVLTAYMILTALDICGIYMELRQVVFRTLNAERSTSIIEHYLRDGSVLTPARVSGNERIFRRPRYRARVRFSSIAKAARTPEELAVMLSVFRREHFLVSMPAKNGACRVVLRQDASNDDVMRALLTVGYTIEASNQYGGAVAAGEEAQILRNSRKLATKSYPTFKRALREAGWNTNNLLFGTLKRRGEWRRERDGS